MTASGRPGRPVAVTRGDVDDFFARGPDDALLHVRRDFFGRHGTSLGGELAGDPTVVLTTTGRLHAFARCRGGRLLHWIESPGEGMAGPIDHGWRIAYDPVAVAGPNGSVGIHARGANDELVRWRLPDTGPPSPAESLGGSVVATPAAVYRRGALPDVFVVGADGSLNHHGVVARLNGNADFVGWRKVGTRAVGAPMVVSWSAPRLDVLAPGTSSAGPRLLHWGFDARKGFHTEVAPGGDPQDPSADRLFFNGTWFGPDTSDLGAIETLACVIATEPDHAQLFARDANGKLQRWHWDGGFFPDDLGWFGPELVAEEAASQPTALVVGEALVYAWVGEGTTMIELKRQGDAWTRREFPINWQTVEDQIPSLELPVDVDLLVSRAADLLRLGVSWSGFTVADGDPPALVPAAAAGPPTLRLVLPPQHIGEELQPEGTPIADDDQVWQSQRSGPSQLVFDVPPVAIPLTPAGLLAAVRGARLRGQDQASGEIHTFVELPWQLFVSPDGATAEHPIEPAGAGQATVALWRTRLRSASGDLAIRRAGGEDSFVPPLSAANRRALAAESSPAQFERLELSSLGGTLRAHGEWDGLDWQHDSTLGRDGRVRVEMRGLLYPYGHRAVFTTITERHLTDAGPPIAVLRQRSFLTITDPTQARPVDDDEQARAFPFDDVTITTRVFEVGTPDWRLGTRPGHVPEQILAEVQAAQDELAAMPRVVDGWTGPPPVDELAATFPAADGTVEADQASLAIQRLAQIERIQDLQQRAEALRELDTKPVPLFFCPRSGAVWVEFPVTCRLGEQTLSFTTPMLFVRDERLPETPTQPAFDTLVDGDVQARLAREWATIRSGRPPAPAPAAGVSVLRDTEYAGVIALAGQSLDLLGTAATDDRQLVNRMYVSGKARGREFRPRLGPATPLPPDVTQPAWGLDVTLPSLRELLPGRAEAHRVVTTLSQAYLDSGAESVEVVHEILGPASGTLNAAGQLVDQAGTPLSEVRGVVVDFTGDAERSGGLAAPKMTADGLSRLVGPVNVEGLTSLDPGDLLDEGATLLGFSLTDLLGPLNREDLPTITTDLSGPQPVVTMSWPPFPPGTPPEDRPRQELAVKAPFGPIQDPPGPTTPKPTMALEVRTAGADVRTECSVRDFSLGFPSGEPLLKLTFREVRYVQEAGKPPALEIDGLSAAFSDKLDLLKALQEKVGLAGQGPAIRVDDSGIVASYALAVPDAASGAFVMRNLVFSASVTVPFQGDPVVVGVAFASRAKPFNLSVMMFGGGGYAAIELAHDGLRRMEIALEFGASIAVDFVIAKGEAHVLGGIRFELLADDSVQLVGYLRIGGSLEVLGLVTVTVELVLSLGYQSNGNRLVGRATLVIELDLTLYSDSVELDSGEWEIAGGDPTRRVVEEPAGPELLADRDPYVALLREHRAAFRSAAEA